MFLRRNAPGAVMVVVSCRSDELHAGHPVRALLAEFPQMPSIVIMERIGWTRGKTVLFDRIYQPGR